MKLMFSKSDRSPQTKLALEMETQCMMHEDRAQHCRPASAGHVACLCRIEEHIIALLEDGGCSFFAQLIAFRDRPAAQRTVVVWCFLKIQKISCSPAVALAVLHPPCFRGIALLPPACGLYSSVLDFVSPGRKNSVRVSTRRPGLTLRSLEGTSTHNIHQVIQLLWFEG